jgi:hypothetical protein
MHSGVLTLRWLLVWGKGIGIERKQAHCVSAFAELRRKRNRRLSPPGGACRQFVELADPAGPHPGFLQDVVSKHAEPLVSHMLAALAAAGGADADLSGDLLAALLMVCGVAHFLPEMAADR